MDWMGLLGWSLLIVLGLYLAYVVVLGIALGWLQAHTPPMRLPTPSDAQAFYDSLPEPMVVVHGQQYTLDEYMAMGEPLPWVQDVAMSGDDTWPTEVIDPVAALRDSHNFDQCNHELPEGGSSREAVREVWRTHLVRGVQAQVHRSRNLRGVRGRAACRNTR